MGQGEVGFLQRSDSGEKGRKECTDKPRRELPIYSYT